MTFLLRLPRQKSTKHLTTVFRRLKNFGLSINPSQCTLGVNEINFLGYRINSNGLTPMPEKVKAVKNFPQPNTVAKLRRFLGVINFIVVACPTPRVFKHPCTCI